MSLWKIAWRSIQQRGLASSLTALSMALGVTMVVAVLLIHGVVSESFRNNSSLGYNMIVGANKGGKLQLVLNTVFYLSQPAENIPYEFYLEFLTAERVKKLHPPTQLKKLMVARLDETAPYRAGRLAKTMIAAAQRDEERPLTAEQTALLFDGQFKIATETETAEQVVARLDEEGELRKLLARRLLDLTYGEAGRLVELLPPEARLELLDGLYSRDTNGEPNMAIPVMLGDYYKEYRLVGTNEEMFNDRVYDLDENRKFEFTKGRNFKRWSKEHGFFEAVVGAKVARQYNLKLGDPIYASHGAVEGEGQLHEESAFTVVGLLAPSGTPNDRAVFVNMEGFC